MPAAPSPFDADAPPEATQADGGVGLSAEQAGAKQAGQEHTDWWAIARRKRLCDDLPLSIRAAFKRARNSLVQGSPHGLRIGLDLDNSQASLISEDLEDGVAQPLM